MSRVYIYLTAGLLMVSAAACDKSDQGIETGTGNTATDGGDLAPSTDTDATNTSSEGNSGY